MDSFLSVFVTVSTADEANSIARTIIEERLAACATVMPGAHSFYQWDGKLEEAHECVLIIKIRADQFDALEKRIKVIHSYDCPCIVAWPIVSGSESYLAWLNRS